MTLRTALATATLCALAACGTTTTTATETSGTVVESLVGKQLVSTNGTVFLFNPNGTVGGVFEGETIVGTYAADATEVCSFYTRPTDLSGREFCSIPVISGDTVVFNRADGSTSQPYTIGG